MKIADITITPIAVADPPLLNAAGLHAPYALRIVIEIACDDGVSGIGEIPCTSAVLAAAREMPGFLIGRSPFERTKIRQTLEDRFPDETAVTYGRVGSSNVAARLFAGVDVALLDIIGKETGRPVVDLLGGAVRDRVDFSAYLFFKYEGSGGELGFSRDARATGWEWALQDSALDPNGIVRQAEAMVAEFGFRSLKLKGGVFHPRDEVAAIQALRERFGPDIPLRLDPNAVWSLETSIEYGKELEGVLEYYEDPCRGQENMASLRGAVNIPRATNMCTTSFDDIPGSVALNSEDIILSDHHMWGGLQASMELARMCATFGRRLSMHSNSHLGISLAAMIHLSAALPELSYAVDTHYPWQRDEVIVGGKITIENGSAALLRAPGLGIELDRAELNRLHAAYVECGYTDRDDEVEMQKVDPGWQYSQTRW